MERYGEYIYTFHSLDISITNERVKPLLLTSLTKLRHLEEIHITVFLDKPSHLKAMLEFSVTDIFNFHSTLHVVSLAKVNRKARFYPRVCSRRRWDGLEKVSMEELKLLNRDGFPRMMNDVYSIGST